MLLTEKCIYCEGIKCAAILNDQFSFKHINLIVLKAYMRSSNVLLYIKIL